jgi:exosome complex RNA-binding protein Csl4
MGTVTRHSGAPFANAETLDGTDLETDISNLVSEVNGNLDNSNIASGADINGSKLANATVTAAKMVTSTLTTAQFSAASVPYTYVETNSTGGTADTNTAYVDVPNITAITATNLTSGDKLLFEFIFQLAGAGSPLFFFTFDVDGANVVEPLIRYNVLSTQHPVMMIWTHTATATAHTIKPTVSNTTGAASQSYSNTAPMVLRVTSFPQK